MTTDKITTSVVGENVVITMPIEILVQAFDECPILGDEYKVGNKCDFAKGLCIYLDNAGGNPEIGSTGLEDLLDKLFVEMVEDACDCIVEVDGEDGEDE